MRDVTREWLDDAEYDIKSAGTMLRAGRYFYVVFMCHLAVEKMLKAAWMETRDDDPPRVHGLVYLYEKLPMKDSVPENIVALIGDLDGKGELALYTEGRQLLAGVVNRDYADKVYRDTVEAVEWLAFKVLGASLFRI